MPKELTTWKQHIHTGDLARHYSALIFDCDGTLVDSMPLHYRAWTESLAEHNAPYPFTEDTFYGYAGIKEEDIVARLNASHGASVDPLSVAHRKTELFCQHFHTLKPVQEVLDLAHAHHGKLPMAVASGSPLHLVEDSLKQIDALELFETIVTPEQVKAGKPAPDMFLLSAERMSVAADKCLVFEDGQSGIDAAQAAGMDWGFVDSREG